MLDRLDNRISVLSEHLARSFSRRRLLAAGIKGGFATIAAATLGTLTHVGEAFAVCCSGPNMNCPGQPSCPSGGGCPSGCSACINNECSGCPHSNGQWSCACGTCGLGTRLCTDCKCPNCSARCTCYSACSCSTCCSPADVEAEMARLAISARRAA